LASSAGLLRRATNGSVAASALWSFALFVVSRGLGALTGFALAVLLGAAGYGAYSFAMALASSLMVPALVGTDGLLVREIATYRRRRQWPLTRGILLRTAQAVLSATLVLGALAALVGIVASSWLDPELASVWWLGLAIMPLLAFINLIQAAMRGLSHVVLGQVPVLLIKPGFFALFVGVAWLWLGDEISAPLAILLTGAAALLALLAAWTHLLRRLPREVKAGPAEFRTRVWVQSAAPMLAIGLVQVVNAHVDIVMIGALLGAGPTGVFTLANTVAGLVLLALNAVNAVLGPALVTAHASGDRARLQQLVTRTTRGALMAALPLAMVFLILGGPLLALFGAEFTEGRLALAVLTVGHLFNVFMGSVGLILIMTGHERDAAWGIALATLVHVLLNAVLIPHWGVVGAAAANAGSVILWNFLLARRAYVRLGLHTSALGVLGRRGAP